MDPRREALWDRAVVWLDGASTTMDDGRLDRALVLARRAVSGLARAVGERHPDYVNARLELGRVLQARGRPQAALGHMELAARALSECRGGGETVVAMAVNARLALARCLQDLGRLDEGRRHARAALRRATRRLGPRNELVAQAHNQIGMLGKFSGRFAEAASHYRAALPLFRELYGPVSREMATLWHNIGGLEHARGRFARGEPPARRAVTIARRLLPEGHPELLAHEVAHAALLDGLARHGESLRIYRRAIAGFVRRFGRVNYEVASTLHNLAGAEEASGRAADALRHYAEARRLLTGLRGPKHPDVGLTLLNAGSLYADIGRSEQATPLLRRAHACFREALGAAHPYTRASQAALERLSSDSKARRPRRRIAKRPAKERPMNTTNHPRLLAHLAGALYVIITACALFAYLYVRGQLTDTADMARTADNIVANEQLYRMGLQAPRSWTERAYPKLIYYNRLEKGGHFAAWEQPELFSEEVRAGFRPLRKQVLL